MAEVLHYPRKPNGQSYYNSSSPLKRSSSSYSSFLSQAASPFPTSRNSPPTPPIGGQQFPLRNTSVPSPSPGVGFQSFSDLSASSPLPPTPAASVSLDEQEYSDEDIAFPSYDDGVRFYHTDEPLLLNDSSSEASNDSDDGDVAQPPSVASESTRSSSPLPTPIVSDDTAIKPNISRHVDYLSHNWREEDIWCSWRHIVSQRSVYGQRSRLENASWRTWAKSKYRLPTVSPETLNWLKESDVTWLYGPLANATTHPITHTSADDSPMRNAYPTSSSNKKPILKKRSMSEVMLQRSLSANSLLKQAAASVQAQQTGHSARPGTPYIRRPSDFHGTKITPREQPDYFSTIPSSGGSTPSESGRRHIRFDDKVEQCIAVNAENPDADDSSDDDMYDSDSSDEGILTMRKPKRRPTIGSRSAPPCANKIIEKLPDTTLKYKLESDDSPTPSPGLTRSWQGRLFQSASQETIRPSNPSRNFLLNDDDSDDDEVGPETAWQPNGAFAKQRDVSTSVSQVEHIEESDHFGGPSNMRRTPSGMFMPYEDDDDDTATEMGLFGRVSETINTAKDIAHVIWNVGWRK